MLRLDPVVLRVCEQRSKEDTLSPPIDATEKPEVVSRDIENQRVSDLVRRGECPSKLGKASADRRRKEITPALDGGQRGGVALGRSHHIAVADDLHRF